MLWKTFLLLKSELLFYFELYFSCLEYDRSSGNIVCEHLLPTVLKLGVTRQVFNLFQDLWNRFPYLGVGGAKLFGAKAAQTGRGLAPAETYLVSILEEFCGILEANWKQIETGVNITVIVYGGFFDSLLFYLAPQC